MELELYFKIVAYVLSVVVGLCIGSFLNVVIYRLPNNMSLAKPSSHCPKCNYSLKWYDNIPVISYLILGGKCRSCKTKISFRYTLVELLTALSFGFSVFMFWNTSIPLALIYMAVSAIFICVFFIDLEHKIIFDRFHLILLALGVASIFFDSYGWLSHLLGGAIGFTVFFSVSYIFEKVCGKEGLGGGDVKLVGVVGLLLGWERLLLSMLVSTIPAVIILLALSKKDATEEEKQFPFAPFLVVGFFVATFFGTPIINWYLNLLGI